MDIKGAVCVNSVPSQGLAQHVQAPEDNCATALVLIVAASWPDPPAGDLDFQMPRTRPLLPPSSAMLPKQKRLGGPRGALLRHPFGSEVPAPQLPGCCWPEPTAPCAESNCLSQGHALAFAAWLQGQGYGDTAPVP